MSKVERWPSTALSPSRHARSRQTKTGIRSWFTSPLKDIDRRSADGRKAAQLFVRDTFATGVGMCSRLVISRPCDRSGGWSGTAFFMKLTDRSPTWATLLTSYAPSPTRFRHAHAWSVLALAFPSQRWENTFFKGLTLVRALSQASSPNGLGSNRAHEATQLGF